MVLSRFKERELNAKHKVVVAGLGKSFKLSFLGICISHEAL